jgi:hypothetical protein
VIRWLKYIGMLTAQSCRHVGCAAQLKCAAAASICSFNICSFNMHFNIQLQYAASIYAASIYAASICSFNMQFNTQLQYMQLQYAASIYAA